MLDAKKQQNQLDVVQDFAYPLPVTIICQLLRSLFSQKMRKFPNVLP